MKYLKRYNQIDNGLSINESFTNSSEYNDLVSKLGLDDTFFLDSLIDIKSMSRAKVNLYKYISNSKGHILNTDFESNEKYTIKYVIVIKYILSKKKQDIDYKTYSNIVEDLNTIKTSIDEMIDRCSENLELTHNNTTITSGSVDMSDIYDSVITNIIHFDSKVLDNSIIKDTFDVWMSDKGPEFDKMLKELRDIYRKRDINFDQYMDTNDYNDYILIGVFPPDEELYGVAEFNKKTKKWSIDMGEVKSSFRGFDEQNDD